MRLALDQAVGATAAKAIVEIFGTPATVVVPEELRSIPGERELVE